MSGPEANVTLPIPDQLCLDLLTTAFEGGSAYWLACEKVERDPDLNVIKIVGPLVDREDGTVFDTPHATIETMRLGIQRILAPEAKDKIASDIRATVALCLVDPDSTEWDAETADCVLQFGMFGELVYG